MKEYYDLKQKDASFEIDDQVMLYMPAPSPGLSVKLVGKLPESTHVPSAWKETRRVYPIEAQVKRFMASC